MAANTPNTRREYRFMGSTRHLWVGFPVPVLGAVALVYDMAGADLPVFVPVATGMGITALFVFLGLAATRAPATATLCDEHRITVRKAFRTRTTAWQDVQGIEIHNARVVILYDAAGRRYGLPHLDDLECQDLDHEVTLLRQMWLAYRGQDWSPAPEVQDRIARRRQHRQGMDLFTLSFLSLLFTFCAGAGIFVAADGMGMYPRDGIPAPDSFVATLLHPMTLLVVLPVVTTIGLLTTTVIRRRR